MALSTLASTHPHPSPEGGSPPGATVGRDSRVGADPETAERDLVERVLRGDTVAFGQLVERHMRRAYRVALGLVGRPEDAMDLSQDAFVRAFRARATLDPERPFYPWYYQILRRLCFNFLRDRKNRGAKLDGMTPWLVADAGHRATREHPHEEARRAELRRRLAAAVETLPAGEREVLVLREYDDLRYREIAALLGIPEGTVMSRLYKARRRLAALLEDER
ncbi:MAG: sigma-70 family RNA polymerase sigma factor [Holophagales bacterium]|nr:sigma-70 family RNA polymerase sigma factor [Holophagales bacterium]